MNCDVEEYGCSEYLLELPPMRKNAPAAIVNNAVDLSIAAPE
jgi:hypothetical protein